MFYFEADGSPPTIEEMSERVSGYFEKQETLGKPFTFAGLARACGVTTSELQNLMETENPYGALMREARLILEEKLEESLFAKTTAAGAKFVLMNKCNWTEKSEQKTGGEVIVKWEG